MKAARGPPLLFLHGNGENRSCFSAQIPKFSKYFRCISIESRGHGSSTRGTQPLSLSLFADDTVAVLDALAIPPALMFSAFRTEAMSPFILRLKLRSASYLSFYRAQIMTPLGIVPKDLAFLKGTRSILKLKSLFSAERQKTS